MFDRSTDHRFCSNDLSCDIIYIHNWQGLNFWLIGPKIAMIATAFMDESKLILVVRCGEEMLVGFFIMVVVKTDY